MCAECLCGPPPASSRCGQAEVKEYARAGKHLRARQYYGFDPRRDGPPDGVPELCPRCGNANAVGVEKCQWCASEVVGLTRFRLLSNALIHAYYPDRIGLKLGGVGYKVRLGRRCGGGGQPRGPHSPFPPPRRTCCAG